MCGQIVDVSGNDLIHTLVTLFGILRTNNQVDSL